MRPLDLLAGLMPRRTRSWPMACALATLAIALLFGWVLQQGRQGAARQAERTAGTVAAAVAQDIARTITLYDLSLQAVGRGLDLPGLWELAPDLRQMVLFDRAAAAAHFGFLNVLNEAGDVIADMKSKTPAPANFAGRDYFQALRRDPQDQLFISRPVLTGPGQAATVPLVRRRSHPDGSFAGAVVGSMRLGHVQELFEALDLGPGGSIALMRSDGVILMRLPFNPDDIGRSMPSYAPLFRFLASGAAAIDAVDPDLVARTSALHRVGELPLVVSVGLADEAIYRGWRREAAGLAVALLVLAGLQLLLLQAIRRAEADRGRAEALVHLTEEDKSRVITTVSHELRTPLTSVLCYSEMLAVAPGLEPEQAGQVAALQSAGTQLRLAIDRMIDFTRSDLTLQEARPEPVNLDRLLEQCCIVMGLEAVRHGLTLKRQVDPHLPQYVELDPVQFGRVLNNLVSNAVKYTERGGVRVTLTGSARRLRCEVADTGPGVPAAKRSRLFKEFDRLDTERAVPGLGVGLSISARLVKAMGGTIGYRDNPGGGSIFWLEIPTSEASAPAGASPAAAAPVAMGPAVAAPAGPGLRILLAEDDAMNRDAASSFLRLAGHVVTTATNGAEALHIAASEDFDLIITDMRMPRMNGLETAHRIHGLQGPRGETPILLLTGDMQVEQQAGYQDAHVTLRMSKPYSSADLLAAVRTATLKQRPGQRQAGTPPLLDEAVLGQLGSAMSADNVDAHLRTLSGRFCDLLALLRHPKEADAEALSDLVHDTASAAGLLGFSAASAALKRYQHLDAEARTPGAEATLALIGLVEASLPVLRARLPPAGAQRLA